jgi:hypothetical protein
MSERQTTDFNLAIVRSNSSITVNAKYAKGYKLFTTLFNPSFSFGDIEIHKQPSMNVKCKPNYFVESSFSVITKLIYLQAS